MKTIYLVTDEGVVDGSAVAFAELAEAELYVSRVSEREKDEAEEAVAALVLWNERRYAAVQHHLKCRRAAPPVLGFLDNWLKENPKPKERLFTPLQITPIPLQELDTL
jgi:hypothetical protein